MVLITFFCRVSDFAISWQRCHLQMKDEGQINANKFGKEKEKVKDWLQRISGIQDTVQLGKNKMMARS